MSDTPSAAASGQFHIGGALEVNRLGFGAMRIVGKNMWGQPEDPQAARETLRRLPALGINLVDTADAYGPNVSEEIIREVLYPYPPDMLITTKGGNMRGGPRQWARNGSRAYLRQCVTDSLKRLGLEQIGLWQLHRIDPALPADEQFATIAEMIKEGLIRYAGLSEVSIAEIEAAQKHFPVATVQNQYNLVDRKSEDVLDFCEAQGIGFMPWAPLAAGNLASPGSVLAAIVGRNNAAPSQIALAWMLKRSKVMLPIPGTTNPKHLVQNVAAAELVLSDAEFAALDAQGRAAIA